jgi:hypothetical protein
VSCKPKKKTAAKAAFGLVIWFKGKDAVITVRVIADSEENAIARGLLKFPKADRIEAEWVGLAGSEEADDAYAAFQIRIAEQHPSGF